MGTFQRLRGNAAEGMAGFQHRLREGVPDTLKRIATPKRLEKHADGATRTGQILSLLFLGPVIVANLAVIVALNGVMSDIFGTSDYGEAQTGIVGWLVTGITGGAFLFSAYCWFQFVRSAGFGWFNFDD